MPIPNVPGKFNLSHESFLLIELETKMLFQVHDELIFETKKENSSKAMKIIKEEILSENLIDHQFTGEDSQQ